jgi:hypothetical protein
MYNGFAGEGVLVRLSPNAISSLEYFYANEMRAIYAKYIRTFSLHYALRQAQGEDRFNPHAEPVEA